ncbi:MAG: hypothetical protein JNM27_10645 [Leptospirales bacterium]|nr:hypothetical protein [Leptospirales bacterium]
MIPALFNCQADDGTWHLTGRRKCYDEKACYSADSDCAVGFLILRSLTGSEQSNANPLVSLLLSPAVCVGSKKECIRQCNEDNPI